MSLLNGEKMSTNKLFVVATSVQELELLKQLSKVSIAFDVNLQLTCIDNVVAAREIEASHKPDLVLVRIGDGHPEALALLSEVIAAFSSTPVTAWMATSDIALAKAALGQGAVACISDTMAPSDVLLQLLSIHSNWIQPAQQLRKSELESTITLEAIADGVICTDARGVVTFLNSAACRLLLCVMEDGVGRPVTELMSFVERETGNRLMQPAHQVIATAQTFRLPSGIALVRRDGSEIIIEDCACPIVNDSGVLTGVVIVFHDITEAYRMRAEVDYLAWHDYLTRLPNRFAISRHLDHILTYAAAHHQDVPLLYLDLDRFKLINDTLGHSAGDLLLTSVAERLRGCFRLTDLVGRQGGDEFIVIMAPGSTVDEAILAAARIISALTETHQVKDEAVQIGCSIGIASYPKHGESAELLLHHADSALQYAKANGRNSWRVFTPELRADALERRKLEAALRDAVDTGAMTLFYQPKIRIEDGTVHGCEALLRWHHPEWGWVPPTRFIACAESSRLIVPLGRFVLGEAIKQAKAWQERGLNIGTIAVNVSAQEVCHPEFMEHIQHALQASCIDPALIEFELTESVLMQDLDYAIERLGLLRTLGASLAIDDFGTGYSSLSYLAAFPIDVLKIDRSFVHGIHRAGTRQQALLQAIMTLAKALSFRVVAEGIETAEEERFLMQAGCDIGQGYYYGAPMDAPAFERFVASRDGCRAGKTQ